VVAAVGLLSALSLNFAVANSIGDIPASVTQTFTVLSKRILPPIVGGYAVFFLAAGVLWVRTRILPVWVGWLTVLLGIVCLTPVAVPTLFPLQRSPVRRLPILRAPGRHRQRTPSGRRDTSATA